MAEVLFVFVWILGLGLLGGTVVIAWSAAMFVVMPRLYAWLEEKLS